VARYRSTVTSGAALAANAGFGALVPSASVGFLLRRITVGWTSAGAAVTASQQVGVGVGYLTAAGTSATALTSKLISPNGPAAPATTFNTYTTYGTFSLTGGNLIIPLNNQGAADLSWEEPDQWFQAAGVAGGLQFYASQIFPAGVAASVTVEWEE